MNFHHLPFSSFETIGFFFSFSFCREAGHLKSKMQDAREDAVRSQAAHPLLYSVDIEAVSAALEVPVESLRHHLCVAAQHIQNNAGDVVSDPSGSPTVKSPLLSAFSPKGPQSPFTRTTVTAEAVPVGSEWDLPPAAAGGSPASPPSRRDSTVVFCVGSLDGRTESSLARQAKRPARKRVHFPDDVIQSFCIIRDGEAVAGQSRQSSLRMLVSFNRPLLAYWLLLSASLSVSVGWVEVSMSVYPSKLQGQSVAKSAYAVCSAVFAFTSAIFLVYLGLIWRPNETERRFVASADGIRAIGYCVLSGAASGSLLVTSYALHVSCVNFVAFAVVPLLATYLTEMWRKKIIAPVDSAGTLIVIAGLIVLLAGEENAERGKLRLRLGAMLSAVAGACFHRSFAASCRSTCKNVSLTFLFFLALAATTTVSAVVAAALHAFSAPLGPSESDGAGGAILPGPLTHLSHRELLHVSVACGAMFLGSFFQHLAMPYFDRLSLAAGLSLGAPYTILASHIAGLPYAVVGYEVGGSLLVFLGTGGVIYAGWKHRTGVEIVIDLGLQALS